MISESHKLTLAGLYLLKKIDLPAEDGGLELSAPLAEDLAALAPALERLEQQGLVERVGEPPAYALTDAGLDHLEGVMEEAEALIPSDAGLDEDDALETHAHRGLRGLRERFLWAWYIGELDDLAAYQRASGRAPIDGHWARFLLADALYESLDDPS